MSKIVTFKVAIFRSTFVKSKCKSYEKDNAMVV